VEKPANAGFFIIFLQVSFFSISFFEYIDVGSKHSANNANLTQTGGNKKPPSKRWFLVGH